MSSRWITLTACVVSGSVCGCVKIANEEYAINGMEVNTLVGPAGSARPLTLGKANADTVRQRIGEPAQQYRSPVRTDVYIAPEGTRWIFWPMPVAHFRQTLVGRRAILLRLDYDERGTLLSSDTKSVLERPEKGRLFEAAERVWPDLAH